MAEPDPRRIRVANAELRSVRDGMRELNRMIEAIDSGEAERFVLTKHGKMRAALVSLDDVAALDEFLGR